MLYLELNFIRSNLKSSQIFSLMFLYIMGNFQYFLVTNELKYFILSFAGVVEVISTASYDSVRFVRSVRCVGLLLAAHRDQRQGAEGERGSCARASAKTSGCRAYDHHITSLLRYQKKPHIHTSRVQLNL